MAEQATAIELLDVDHPGLRLDVDLGFDRHATLKAVQQMLREKYDADVPEKTIWNYRRNRYQPAKARIQALQEKVRVVIDIAKQVPEEDVLRARIYEELDDLDPKTLLRARFDSAKLQIERDKVEIARQEADTSRRELDLKLAQFEREREAIAGVVAKATDGSPGATGSNVKALDAAAAVKQISAIIGVGGPMEELVEPSGDLAIG